MLDRGGELQGPQLVSWDTVNDELGKVIQLPEGAYLDFSFLQDMALDDKRNKVYIADMTFPGTPEEAKPAIVVVDLETGEARREIELSVRSCSVACRFVDRILAADDQHARGFMLDAVIGRTTFSSVGLTRLISIRTLAKVMPELVTRMLAT